jgi:phosphohistidine phosphatase
MGKTLYVVRHAKARNTEVGAKDIDRELSSEGLQQASRLGAYLYKKNADIDAIVCSSAVRAVQTAELVADQINFDISKTIINSDLYEASVRIIENIILDLNNDRKIVVLVGHNPVLTYFVEHLTGHHFDGIEPCGMVKISSNVADWKLVSKENASFEYYVSPDDYSISN